MRDTIAYDVLEEAGLPASETAYYQVILDYGEGQKDMGLYTMIEVIDDTVINRYFDDDSGNIYEGDGSGHRWQQAPKSRSRPALRKRTIRTKPTGATSRRSMRCSTRSNAQWIRRPGEPA